MNFEGRSCLQKLTQQGFQVLIAMVKSVAGFSQVKMEEFTGHATVRIEPVFSVAPEALDTVDVVPAH
ncbi:hypothetical protein, partial [Ralstonia pseudosolanacearum]|uniref:hypothetical protein n=1 Tax=Ralstonia pseudosolanacearum TaxID=1310165 RepID=UPI003AAEB0C0